MGASWRLAAPVGGSTGFGGSGMRWHRRCWRGHRQASGLASLTTLGYPAVSDPTDKEECFLGACKIATGASARCAMSVWASFVFDREDMADKGLSSRA